MVSSKGRNAPDPGLEEAKKEYIAVRAAGGSPGYWKDIDFSNDPPTAAQYTTLTPDEEMWDMLNRIAKEDFINENKDELIWIPLKDPYTKRREKRLLEQLEKAGTIKIATIRSNGAGLTVRPKFHSLYKGIEKRKEQGETFYGVQTSVTENAQPQPLTWNSKDAVLCWGNRGCHKIPPTCTALRLFLDVMSLDVGTGAATNIHLADEYDRYCKQRRQALEKWDKKIPAYLAKEYSKMPALDFGKIIHRCVNELRVLFDVRPDSFFPIENKSTIENAAWVWHNIGTVENKK